MSSRVALRKYWKWIAILLCLVAAIYAYSWYLDYREQSKLDALILTLNKEQPGWDGSGKRAFEAIPAEENGALVFLSIHEACKNDKGPVLDVWNRLKPEFAERPSEEQLKSLDRQVRQYPQLDEWIRQLSQKPPGRLSPIPQTDTRVLFRKLRPYYDLKPAVAPVLSKAMWHAHQGQGDAAFDTALSLLNPLQAIADESDLMAALCVISLQKEIRNTLLWTLSQTTLSPESLINAKHQWERTCRIPVVTLTVLSEIHRRYQLAKEISESKYSWDELKSMNPSDSWFKQLNERVKLRWGYRRSAMVKNQILFLECIRDLPALESMNIFDLGQTLIQLTTRLNQYSEIPITILFTSKVAVDHAQVKAILPALACELFRIRENRWPSSWNELIPDYLTDIPRDALGGKLLLKSDETGLLIYNDVEKFLEEMDISRQAFKKKDMELRIKLLNTKERGSKQGTR